MSPRTTLAAVAVGLALIFTIGTGWFGIDPVRAATPHHPPAQEPAAVHNCDGTTTVTVTSPDWADVRWRVVADAGAWKETVDVPAGDQAKVTVPAGHAVGIVVRAWHKQHGWMLIARVGDWTDPAGCPTPTPTPTPTASASPTASPTPSATSTTPPSAGTPTPTATPSGTAGGDGDDEQLPLTGAPALTLTGAAALLVTAGAGLIVWARRRDNEQPAEL